MEFGTWRLWQPVLRRLPRGDGHPVLVLPGFTAADRSTVPLRSLLKELGYRTYGWKLGANLGPTPHIVKGLATRLDDILAREDQQISIIGWSLGGIFGREIARNRPDDVRQVISLGSPIRMGPGDPSAASGLWDALTPLHDPDAIEALSVPVRPAPPVPTTAIYSRTDGIVHWRTCRDERGPERENIEVYGSHCGLGVNPAVAIVVADRLAQPAGEWTKFRPPLWARGGFPPRPPRIRRRSGSS